MPRSVEPPAAELESEVSVLSASEPHAGGATSPLVSHLDQSWTANRVGTYESDAGSGRVRVRIDATGESVEAIRAGYPEDFVFEPGDETVVRFENGTWRTSPLVAFNTRHADRAEFWAKNRRTGRFRLLAEVIFESERP